MVFVSTGENRTPEFSRLNPMQKVPVMVDRDFVLTERYVPQTPHQGNFLLFCLYEEKPVFKN